jgi:hypothetical protein
MVLRELDKKARWRLFLLGCECFVKKTNCWGTFSAPKTGLFFGLKTDPHAVSCLTSAGQRGYRKVDQILAPWFSTFLAPPNHFFGSGERFMAVGEIHDCQPSHTQIAIAYKFQQIIYLMVGWLIRWTSLQKKKLLNNNTAIEASRRNAWGYNIGVFCMRSN